MEAETYRSEKQGLLSADEWKNMGNILKIFHKMLIREEMCNIIKEA